MIEMLRRFAHDYMGWCKPANKIEYTGGDNMRAVCHRCNKRILWSSQGWFHAGGDDG